MCDIDPKDIATWSTKSSSDTGGGGNHPSNTDKPGNNGNNTNQSGPIEPEVSGGVGGYSLDKPNKNK